MVKRPNDLNVVWDCKVVPFWTISRGSRSHQPPLQTNEWKNQKHLFVIFMLNGKQSVRYTLRLKEFNHDRRRKNGIKHDNVSESWKNLRDETHTSSFMSLISQKKVNLSNHAKKKKAYIFTKRNKQNKKWRLDQFNTSLRYNSSRGSKLKSLDQYRTSLHQ